MYSCCLNLVYCSCINHVNGYYNENCNLPSKCIDLLDFGSRPNRDSKVPDFWSRSSPGGRANVSSIHTYHFIVVIVFFLGSSYDWQAPGYNLRVFHAFGLATDNWGTAWYASQNTENQQQQIN